MQQTEPRWKALLRAEVNRTSARRASKVIGYAPSTINMVLNDEYKSNTSAIAKCVLEKLKPATKPRKAKPVQLKDVAPQIHAQLKPKYRLWGPAITGRWYNVTSEQMDNLMRGHAHSGVAEFIATVERIGVPVAPTCTKCGGAL
jgi:hypothetical protein